MRKQILNIHTAGIKYNGEQEVASKEFVREQLKNVSGVSGDYIPVTGGILKGNIELDEGSKYSIGSNEKKLKAIYADEVFINKDTLYINGTPVLGTESDTITVKADPDQSILMRTTGEGYSQISSESGITMSVKGDNGNIDMTVIGNNGSINMSSKANINFTAENISLDGMTTIKNLNVTGTVTTVNSDNLLVKDNIIEINGGETGMGVSKGTAGIKINRGEELPYLIEFDEADDMFKVGLQGNLETIASQEYVNKAIANTTPKDHTHNIVTSGSAGFMSAADKVKLDGLNNYTLPVASTSAIGGVKSNEFVKGLSISGNTLTITKGDNSTSTLTLPTTIKETTTTSSSTATSAKVAYATKTAWCTTATGTAAKVATLSGFSKSQNYGVVIYFQYATGSHSNMTLNVNGTGAYPLYVFYNGTCYSPGQLNVACGIYNAVFYENQWFMHL